MGIESEVGHGVNLSPIGHIKFTTEESRILATLLQGVTGAIESLAGKVAALEAKLAEADCKCAKPKKEGKDA